MAALEEKPKRIAAEARFNKLAKVWKAETELVSKVSKRVVHPAYQKIIGMGASAIPLILKDLSANGPMTGSGRSRPSPTRIPSPMRWQAT